MELEKTVIHVFRRKDGTLENKSVKSVFIFLSVLFCDVW